MSKIILRVGDKVRNKSNDEPGEIITIIDDNSAIIEFFDDTMQLSANELIPYSLINKHTVAEIEFKKAIIKNKVNTKIATPSTIPDFIDLHIEKIDSNHMFLNKNQILRKQLNTLQQYLFNAIEQKKFSVIIIHGKGDGILRNEVLKMVKNTFGLNTMSTQDTGKTQVKIN